MRGILFAALSVLALATVPIAGPVGAPGPAAAPATQTDPPGGGLEHVARVTHADGAGVWVRDGYAYVSALLAGFFIVDVRDPEDPVKVAHIPGASNDFSPRDVDLLDVDGRTIAVLAAQFEGTHFVDVTDPTAPVRLSTVDLGRPTEMRASHNTAVVHGTPYVYVSKGGYSSPLLWDHTYGITHGDATDYYEAGIDILDASVPEAPVFVKRWIPPQHKFQCHDITVYADAGRAYCAGGNRSAILDIQDPLDPVVLGLVENKVMGLHHTAMANADHTVLILGDEYNGGQAKRPNGCHGHATTPGGDVSAPVGALWFYDIRDPAAPELLSWFSAPHPAGPLEPASCTAHFGDFVTPTRLAMGWYQAGVVLIDVADPTAPYLVDQWAPADARVWEVRHADGYLFTGDHDHGLDVLRIA